MCCLVGSKLTSYRWPFIGTPPPHLPTHTDIHFKLVQLESHCTETPPPPTRHAQTYSVLGTDGQQVGGWQLTEMPFLLKTVNQQFIVHIFHSSTATLIKAMFVCCKQKIGQMTNTGCDIYWGVCVIFTMSSDDGHGKCITSDLSMSVPIWVLCRITLDFCPTCRIDSGETMSEHLQRFPGNRCSSAIFMLINKSCHCFLYVS